ncbi:MAG: 30S ribosomal protein S2 [Alphaproteobacteria bacterium]
MVEVPTFSIKQLIDAGVHYGHKTMRWNPKMAPYLYGSRDNIHIIDLQQTVPLLHRALETVREVVKNNGRVLFVATKRQASDIVAEAAKRCGQYYVNHRWLAGMLTNWGTVSLQIKTLININQKLAEQETNPTVILTKKEKLQLTRRRDKLERSLGGIMEMGGKPDLLFIIDTNKEDLAVKEAMRLNIPVVAILDSNSNPDGINYPVPGNDDATRAIKLYCKLISDAALAGIQGSLAESGADIGEFSEDILANKDARNMNLQDKDKKHPAKKAPIKKARPAGTNKKDTENK